MLSALVQRLTGERLLHYLQPRLFGPLGIENPTWEMLPPGVDAGGFGLSITTEDIARFGQLYLQKGVWDGAQVVPEAWVTEATQAQVANAPSANGADWESGYGYQFWRCSHGAYRGDGAFGQYCLIAPEQEAVLAITAGSPDMPAVLQLFWKHLLPAMGPAALPENVQSHRALSERLAGLCLPPQPGKRRSPLAASVSSTLFMVPPAFDEVEAIGFDFAGDEAVLLLRQPLGDLRIPCGHGVWSKGIVGQLRFDPAGTDTGYGPTSIAACGAWSDDRTFVVQICACERPFVRTMTCRFQDGHLRVQQRLNVSFAPTRLPDVEGAVSVPAGISDSF